MTNKKRENEYSYIWRLLKQTGLFVARQIPAALQVASSAFIFRQYLKAGRLEYLADMEKLRQQVLKVDVKVRDNLLKDTSLKIKPLIEQMIHPLFEKFSKNTEHIQELAIILDNLTNKKGKRGDLKIFLEKVDDEVLSHVSRQISSKKERELVVSKWTDTLSEMTSINLMQNIIVDDLGLSTTQASALDVINQQVFNAKSNSEKMTICLDVANKIETNAAEIGAYCKESWDKTMEQMDNTIFHMSGVRSDIFKKFKRLIPSNFFEKNVKENSRIISILMVQYVSDIQFMSYAANYSITHGHHNSARSFMLDDSSPVRFAPTPQLQILP